MGYFQTKQGSIFEAVKKSLNVVEKKKVVDYSKVEYILPEDKEKYQKVFNAAMKKFKVKSPGELKSEAEKKKFFAYVDKNYKSDAEKKGKKVHLISRHPLRIHQFDSDPGSVSYTHLTLPTNREV